MSLSHASVISHILASTAEHKLTTVHPFLLQQWPFYTEFSSAVVFGLMDFPGSAGGKEPPANAGDIRDTGSIPGSGRFPGAGMATHSRILAWTIQWTEELGGLQSIHRVTKRQTGLK